MPNKCLYFMFHYMCVLKLYKLRGVELCVVATNVSTMTAEYCHPKTTPDMSIALAVRCSVALPGGTTSLSCRQSFSKKLIHFETFKVK